MNNPALLNDPGAGPEVYPVSGGMSTEKLEEAKGYDEGELIAELLCITGELGGKMERLTTSDHSGRTSKKIVIEYDVQTKRG